jgi:hypothetical protein
MLHSELLDDPTNVKILLHLLYSGPRTNKEIAADFSMMRIRTKTGVLIRGRSGYHYIRSETKKLEKAGFITVLGSIKEKLYGFNLDTSSGLLRFVFDLRDFKNWEYIYNSMGFTSGHLNRVLSHTVFRDASKSEFGDSHELDEYSYRNFLYNYRKALEKGAENILVATLVFITGVTSSVTEIDSRDLWDLIYNRGVENFRSLVKRDFNAYNWKSLPKTMTEDIKRNELETYIEQYKEDIEMPVLNSVIDLWKIKTGLNDEDILELIAYFYLVERLFVYLTYCYVLNSGMKKMNVNFPVRGGEVEVRDEELISSLGFKKVREALKRLSRSVKNRRLEEDQKTVVVFERSIYLENEFIELIRVRFSEEAKVEEKREENYMKATGKWYSGLSLKSAIEVTQKKKLTVRTMKVIDLVKGSIKLYGIGTLRGIRTLEAALSNFGYKNYFDKIHEMYKIKLSHKSDK